jgi:hypothetical protein
MPPTKRPGKSNAGPKAKSSVGINATDDSNSQSSRLTPLAFCLLLMCGVVAAAMYSNTASHGIVLDDESVLKLNKYVTDPSTPLADLLMVDFWAEPMSSNDSHKSFRPLYTFGLRYLYSFYGMNASAYHVANIIAHALSTSLVFWLTFRFTKADAETSFVCGMLFAVHPVHTESVANIAHGADIFSAVFYMLSIILFTMGCSKHDSTDFFYIFLASLTFICAGLSKETGLTAIGITTLWSAIPLLQMFFGPQQSSSKRKGSSGFNAIFVQFILRGMMMTLGKFSIYTNSPI